MVVLVCSDDTWMGTAIERNRAALDSFCFKFSSSFSSSIELVRILRLAFKHLKTTSFEILSYKKRSKHQRGFPLSLSLSLEGMAFSLTKNT